MMNQDSRAKLSDRLGLNQASVFDQLKRSDYDSDDAYLDALTKLEMERRSPEYREIRRQLTGAYQAYNEEKIREQQHDDFMKYRAAAQLDFLDRKEIDAEARRLAEADLAAGKIGRDGLGAAIAEYGKTLEGKKLDTKAANAQMNAMFRGQSAE